MSRLCLLFAFAGVTMLAGCGSNSNESVDPVTDVEASDTVTQTIVYVNEDGTTAQRTVQVPRAKAEAELLEKTRLSEAYARGEELPPPRVHPLLTKAIKGAPGLAPQAFYGDEEDNCYSTDMWLSSSATGIFNGTLNMICFVKNTVGGGGVDNLNIFYMPASAQCAGGDFTVSHCERSWWAGTQTGAFYSLATHTPGPRFAAQQQCINCQISKFAGLGFD